MSKLVLIFTDLDGTMISHTDYSHGRVKIGIKALRSKENNYIVIPCTSKTEEEVQVFGADIELDGPFIVENGGKIIPSAFGLFSNFEDENVVSALEIHRFLDQLPKHMRQALRCFHDLSLNELIDLTGLDDSGVRRAKARRHSVVFKFDGDQNVLSEISDILSRNDYQIVQGGRFFHIIGQRNKAGAAKKLINWGIANSASKDFEVWALGDAPNDLALLKLADKSAIIKNPAISQQGIINAVPSAYLSKQRAPEGWLESLEFLKSNTRYHQ